MSGHSHWATIKRAKAANDAKRGKNWSKLARAIIVAAKHGGGNPDDNLTLRYAIDKARAANMPNDTISNAVKKGSGGLQAETYETVMYEGYGPAGVAFMVECATDNRHRTAPEMRKIFERAGGQMGTLNCVAWMFEKKGTFMIEAAKADEDALMELALDAGADDVQRDGDFFQVTCDTSSFSAVRAALAKKGIETVSGELAMLPKNSITVNAEQAAKVLHLMDVLEEHDDVQNVYANFDIPDDVMAQLNKP
ncbi:MAG: YebC/PmpR family DNA-binding transcriptional regulator [Planctomycetota bacterium]|nr:YebC/PmpR family DNA-binding transcriptional regulator [Planctomycetota bacterium]